jgi:hypothetical protein
MRHLDIRDPRRSGEGRRVGAACEVDRPILRPPFKGPWEGRQGARRRRSLTEPEDASWAGRVTASQARGVRRVGAKGMGGDPRNAGGRSQSGTPEDQADVANPSSPGS